MPITSSRKRRRVLGVFLSALFLTAPAAYPAGRAAAPARTPARAAAQAETHSVRRLPFLAKDIVYERNAGKIYASVPSNAAAGGNSIAVIDPATGAVEGSTFVGSEPGKLALADDARTLYVSLEGAAAVRRFDLLTQTPGLQFALGERVSDGPFFVRDMAVAPGNPALLAVSRRSFSGSPDFEGVAVYDNGVRRPAETREHTGSEFIDFSASASTLYGLSGCCGSVLQKMSVDASGVKAVQSTNVSGGEGEFKVDGGLLYTRFGQVYEPETATLVGTYVLPVPGGITLSVVETDAAAGRVYFLTGENVFFDNETRTVTLRAFDKQTFAPTGTLTIPNVAGQVSGLVRWGANGLAFRTSGGHVYLIQTTLVPSDEPVPTPTPTPSPTATPSPTPVPTPAPGELREVPVAARDIVIDPATQTIFASVPSSVGAGGNSITTIDPVSGTVGTPVFVGSEPGKMAITDNGQYIYVGLDGANAVRRYDVGTNMPGLQFTLGAQTRASDIETAPGRPETVAVLKFSDNSSGPVALYDEGVQRPITSHTFNNIDVIEFSASPQLLYGHNNTDTGGEFTKMAAPSCGVSILSEKSRLLQAFANDFVVENGLAYATSGRVADPEAGTLVGTYPVFHGIDQTGSGFGSHVVLADAKAGRVYFFLRARDLLGDTGPKTMLVRAFDMHTFMHLGTLAVPNVAGEPRAAVRWGANGFAVRTTTNKVYLLQTSLIPGAPSQPAPAAPTPTPPTYTLRGTVAGTNAPPVTLNLSGGQTAATTTTDANGNFVFEGLAFCTDHTVTPSPLENYTFQPPSSTITPAQQNNPNQRNAFFNVIPNLVRFDTDNPTVGEGIGGFSLRVIRTGNTSSAATVFYQTGDGTASERADYTVSLGTLRFAPGETQKLVTLFVTDDVRAEPSETFTLSLVNPSGALVGDGSQLTITITDNDPANGAANPIDGSQFFVRQHYLDFLNRAPDAPGLQFWSEQIEQCGADQQCREVRRVNVSAAFFLSIEFQETGFLVYRVHKAAFGDLAGRPVPVRQREFLADARAVGEGVQVGVGNWQQRLEANKNAFAAEFVTRAQFTSLYPSTMTAAEFVDKLNANAGGALSQGERDSLVNGLGGGTLTRAEVLRAVAEDADLRSAETNKAFVLMQYFGYLRRNPDDPQDTNFDGFNFWLTKLNQFNGNFVEAEMVRAFLDSIEYRQRFGQ